MAAPGERAARGGRRGRRIASTIAGAVILAARAAAAQVDSEPPQPTAPLASVTVDWLAPAGCASAARVERRVAELLEFRTPPRTLAARARVVALAGGAVRLTLVIDPDGVPRERIVEAPTCDELVQAAALILALAVDPEVDPAAPRFGDVAACPPTPACPAPDVAAPKPEEGTHEPRAPLVLLVGGGDEPPGARRPGGAVGVGARAEVGTLAGEAAPGVAPGVVLVGELRPGPWLLELQAASLAVTVREEGDESRGAALTLVEGAARGCWLAGGRGMEVGPCVGLAAGALNGHGIGVRFPERATAPWAAARGGLSLRWVPRAARGALWLDGDLGVPLVRPRFDLAGERVYRAPRAGIALAAGVALTFE